MAPFEVSGSLLLEQEGQTNIFFSSIIHFYSPFLHKFLPYPGGGWAGTLAYRVNLISKGYCSSQIPL